MYWKSKLVTDDTIKVSDVFVSIAEKYSL